MDFVLKLVGVDEEGEALLQDFELPPKKIRDKTHWNDIFNAVSRALIEHVAPPEGHWPLPKIPNGRYTFTRNEETRRFLIQTGSDKSSRLIAHLTDGNPPEPFGRVGDNGVICFPNFRSTTQMTIQQWWADMINVLVGNIPSRYDKSPEYKSNFEWDSEMRCYHCNKPLTTEWGLQHGIDPVCAHQKLGT